jgi:3-oxoacyl-[acyl-carrier-protein] synthase II
VSGSVRIRGAGVVCALGVGMTAVAAAVASGGEFAAFRGQSSSHPAYPAPFDARRDLPRGLGRRLGRQLAMSLSAVLDAVGPGTPWREAPTDTGIVGATAHGPMDETVDFVAGVRRDGPKYASPTLFSSALHNSMAGVVARELGTRGPSIVLSNGDVSFETALLVATAGLSSGRMKRAIVVGADAFHPLYARSLSEFHLLSDSTAPLDPTMRRTARGMLLGEGAGALVLDWDEGSDGVRVDDVRLGADVPHGEVPEAGVQLMATGDAASVRRHADALARCGVAVGDVGYPAARFGAFSSLSAVAIAVEAARRLRLATETLPTLFVAVPHGANAATVLLSGNGGV